MSQINLTKKNLKILDLKPGYLVRLVPEWVGCCVE